MTSVQKAYLELHIAVLLFGFTAILGDLIQLNALMLVWWRVLMTSVSLVFFIKLPKAIKAISPKILLQYGFIGVLVALHWLCFYGSIKLANASIALIAMATTSFFSSIIEPLVMKRPFEWFEMMLGLLIIPGMALIVSTTDFSLFTGLMVGLLAALLASYFTILNKKLVGTSDEMTITFFELGSSWLFLSVVIPIFYLTNSSKEVVSFWPSPSDWLYLIVLSLLCTTLAYILALRSLRQLSAFASNLTVNLEPVYGIVLAWLILKENEELSIGFYVGVFIILLAIFSYPFLKKRFGKS
ncbi:MAG: EamA family transporter [Bacteroidota bacterium]